MLGASLEAHVYASDNSALARDCRRDIKSANAKLLKLGRKVLSFFDGQFGTHFYSFIQLNLPADVGANGMWLHETTLIIQTLLKYGVAVCYELHFGDVPYGHDCRECVGARLSSTIMF